MWIIGAFSTEFRKWPRKSFKDLTRDAYLGVLADSGLADGLGIESAWFANSGMEVWGQASVRGQMCLSPLLREGLFPKHTPVINIENACAGGSAAAHCAGKDILSGQSELSLAIGVEKLYFPGVAKEKVLEGFSAGIDNFDREAWIAEYRSLPDGNGEDLGLVPGRSLFVEACAARARWHMSRHGTTVEQIAAACAKSHWYGARNPRAQYQFEVSQEAALKDRIVSPPLTRAMCASPGDGAAALLLCSGEMLRALPDPVRHRAIRLAASALAGGVFREMGGPGAAHFAGRKAYKLAGVGPREIDVAELHDSTSFCEIEQAEMLGLCEAGEGGPFVASGATSPGGRLPVNTSGGLVSKSHPVAATGLSMLNELVEQLRGEAGERQVPGAQLGLQYNCGGAIGLDDAIGSVMILRA
ncbi:MAG: thiolase family protein [Acidobacteriota bacterium]|nr:thiolase family protein [Acidobacteriota bacterium]